MSAHTLKAVFGEGLTCTVTFDPAIHSDRATGYVRPAKHWCPQPTEAQFAAFFTDYVAWIHTVNSKVATLINRDYRTVLQNRRVKPAIWEAWIYHPDGTSECVAKGSGDFPTPS